MRPTVSSGAGTSSVRSARGAALGIADSQYNEAELVETGYRATKVVPLLLDPTELTRIPTRS